jgi:alkanesulfonate monooxygenase SsuD/methylene tetrahydromethanopterin reductase-like flavin-dependent oxidoreductase (luciferase family)
LRVGIMNAVRNHPDSPGDLRRLYADCLADAVLAEELGFDFAWYGEHHFTEDQWSPSPLVLCAAVAARTERLRVGVSVLCLPFHDPLRVAEDVAVIDNLSGGRFDFGIGAGSQYEEYETFGVPIAERFGRMWEAIDLIERCYGDENRFSHAGRYFTYPNVAFTTKPVQRPMPVWVGAFGQRSVTRAVRRGYHLMAPDFGRYAAALREAGRDPADFHVAPMQMVALAETADAAWAAAGQGLLHFVNFYRVRRRLDGTTPPPEVAMGLDRLQAGESTIPVVVGTPADAAPWFTGIREGRRGRATHVPVGFRHAGMETADVHRSMRLFAREILPSLREGVGATI